MTRSPAPPALDERSPRNGSEGDAHGDKECLRVKPREGSEDSPLKVLLSSPAVSSSKIIASLTLLACVIRLFNLHHPGVVV